MSKIRFNQFGIIIEERGEKLYLQFDAGHFNINYVECEITEKEATKAQMSEKDAYEVIIALENEKRGVRELPR